MKHEENQESSVLEIRWKRCFRDIVINCDKTAYGSSKIVTETRPIDLEMVISISDQYKSCFGSRGMKAGWSEFKEE